MTKSEALAAAEQADLDLVEISPQADPPVAKIIDWGKFNYQRTKQLQKNKRNTKTLEVKQMRVGLKISDHDLEVKGKKVREFLEEGHKVKYTLRFKGRELAHRDVGFNLAQKIIDTFGETIVVDQQPIFAGKQLTFVIRRSASAKNATKIRDEQSEQQEISKESTGVKDA
jgi:translation initiation factor IF-3